MNIEVSNRIKKLPPYLFVEIDKAKRRARSEGRDIIDLGVGDPDSPAPDFVVSALTEAVRDASTHRYALDAGLPALREHIAEWYRMRFGVCLDPATEVLPLIGSKEGIAHMPLAFINPGDIALVPEPCYPPYKSGVLFAGGSYEVLPLNAERNYLPAMDQCSESLLDKAKMLYLNYPNNPTSACADPGFFSDIVARAERHSIIVAHDAAYTEICYDGYRPPSFLQVPGAKEVGVEFHSLSKTFNMTGWRIGFVAGNADIISALAKVKSNIDSGIFTAIQRAGIAALRHYEAHIHELRRHYQERRDILYRGMRSLGFDVAKPSATFYLWIRCRKGLDSLSMAGVLLEKADIVVTPGVGFGAAGEGFFRMALTVASPRLEEALERIKKAM